MIAAVVTEAASLPSRQFPDHLSWSSLQAYRICPRRYYYRYIDRAPAECCSATLAFGSAIHRAIERAHESRIAGKGIPPVDDLMLGYESGWAESAKVGIPVVFNAGDDEQSLRDGARRMLEAYLGHLMEERGEVVGIEHEAMVHLAPSAPPLMARIDLMELVGDELVVTDFKTSRAGWGEGKTSESLPQLIVYGRAIQPIAKAMGAKRIITRFVVLTKGKKPAIQVLTPRPTDDGVTKLAELVGDTWKSISGNGGFPRCEGWQCKQCPFAKRCLGKASPA